MSEDRRAVVVSSMCTIVGRNWRRCVVVRCCGGNSLAMAAAAPSAPAWPSAQICQEAGPTGFGLHRALVAAGVDSVIVAPGLVPSRPGDRVKTDKRDARRLAGLRMREP